MHIADGILPIAVAAGGYAVTGATTWYSLRKIRQQPDHRAEIPKAALLTAAFFVASWIHIPVPPTSVHLVLNGLLGVLLGWFAFPAILIGLVFQAVMFGHGGLTTLGVNAAMMGIPALLAFGIFRARTRFGAADNARLAATFGALGSATATAVSVLIFYTLLVTTISTNIDAATEQTMIAITSFSHLPVLLIEAALTAMLVVYLLRVKPALLQGVGTTVRQPTPVQAAATTSAPATTSAAVGEPSEAARA